MIIIFFLPNNNTAMHHYRAFNLSIHSELFFPELAPIPAIEPLPGAVTIQYGYVEPNGIAAPINKGAYFQAKPSVFWLNIPDVAWFLVQNGQAITIHPRKGADEDSFRVFILGTCLAALLMQRGFFLLHGNVIQFDQRAIALTGASGAGKSTLTGAFLQRGYAILADDVCAVNANHEVIPGFPQLKLWADAAQQLAIDTRALRKIRPQYEKFAVPLGANYFEKALPLKKVYSLATSQDEGVKINHLSGVEKFKCLYAQTYKPFIAEGFSQPNAVKKQCAILAGEIDLAAITRPQAGYSLDKLVDCIELDLMS